MINLHRLNIRLKQSTSKLQRRFENFPKNFQNSPRKIKLSEATPQKTHAQQLATVMRAGPGEGRSKLLMAITLSTDSALRFHYETPESSIEKGAGKGQDPVRRTDNSTSTDPLHSMQGDATAAGPPKTEEAPPSTSSPAASSTLPAASPAGSSSTPGTSGKNRPKGRCEQSLTNLIRSARGWHNPAESRNWRDA